jgi:hypothetical protein
MKGAFMRLLLIFTLSLASTMAYALIPLKDEKIIELAKLSMEEHLLREGLTIDDAKMALAFKDSASDKSTIYFEVDNHHGAPEIYVVVCRKKCYLNYR